MPTTPRKGLPTFWSTHIARALVGEQPCLLAPWVSGHLILEKRTRDQSSLAAWKANHTELLSATVERFRAEGWKCSVEQFWRVTGQSAILSGKADLILQQPDKRPLIVDVKSGTPKESDIAQVALEMVAIPLAWNSPQMVFSGEVIYPTHTVSVTPADAETLKPKLFALLKKLGTMSRPKANPSRDACRYCDVPDSECGKRFQAENEPQQVAATSFF